MSLLHPCDYIIITNGIAVLDDWNNMKQTTTIGEVLPDIHQPALNYTNSFFRGHRIQIFVSVQNLTLYGSNSNDLWLQVAGVAGIAIENIKALISYNQ